MKSSTLCNGLLLWILLSLVAACDAPDTGEWHTEGVSLEEIVGTGPTITIGDIEPDMPTGRMHRLRPLADHLAIALGWEKRQVGIRIARSVQELSTLIRRGEVDLYIDSSYPVLLVSLAASSEVLLESPVNGERSYNSLIISKIDSEIGQLADLRGQTIALQEFYSTSGYLLPLSLLLERGFEVEYLAGPAVVSGERIGFFFSGDEENTLSMLRQGKVAAGAISGTDWQNLPDDVKQGFNIVARSNPVPRKLLLVRSGIDDDELTRIREALLSITDEERQSMAAATGWSWEFIPLDAQSEGGIATTREMIRLTSTVVMQ